MPTLTPLATATLLLLCTTPMPCGARAATLPDESPAIVRPTSYDTMAALLASIDGKGPIRVSVEAKTAQGRSIFLVHATHGGEAPFRVLFYAQQHGDEVAGKEALLLLLRDIASRPETLPAGIDLWILPMLNPDGAEAGTRRNAANVDLNRDHIVQEQPETQALHRVARRARPQLAVDCHEFERDGAKRAARGVIAWPDITMDGLNNPLFDPAVIAAAQRWVDTAEAALTTAGYRYARYTVGGVPPRDEQRHSAPDIDAGLNAIGMYAGLSFIIESAVRRDVPDPQADLARRVDAYGVLLRRFLSDTSHRATDVAAVDKARRRPLPAFLPTNYLWVNPGATVTEIALQGIATGRALLRTSRRCSSATASRSRRCPHRGRHAPRAVPRCGSRTSSTRSTRAMKAARSCVAPPPRRSNSLQDHLSSRSTARRHCAPHSCSSRCRCTASTSTRVSARTPRTEWHCRCCAWSNVRAGGHSRRQPSSADSRDTPIGGRTTDLAG